MGAFCTEWRWRNSQKIFSETADHILKKILQESGFDFSGRPDCLIWVVIAVGKLPSPFVSPPGK